MEIYLIGLNIMLIGVIFILIRGAREMHHENRMLKGFSGSVLEFTSQQLNIDPKTLHKNYMDFISARNSDAS